MEFDKSLGAEVPEDEDITIEHIMPQSRKNWEEIINPMITKNMLTFWQFSITNNAF